MVTFRMIVLVMLGKEKIGNILFETIESVFVNKIYCLFFFIMSANFEDGDMIMTMAMMIILLICCGRRKQCPWRKFGVMWSNFRCGDILDVEIS